MLLYPDENKHEMQILEERSLHVDYLKPLPTKDELRRVLKTDREHGYNFDLALPQFGGEDRPYAWFCEYYHQRHATCQAIGSQARERIFQVRDYTTIGRERIEERNGFGGVPWTHVFEDAERDGYRVAVVNELMAFVLYADAQVEDGSTLVLGLAALGSVRIAAVPMDKDMLAETGRRQYPFHDRQQNPYFHRRSREPESYFENDDPGHYIVGFKAPCVTYDEGWLFLEELASTELVERALLVKKDDLDIGSNWANK